jgi:hypothetical protein
MSAAKCRALVALLAAGTVAASLAVFAGAANTSFPAQHFPLTALGIRGLTIGGQVTLIRGTRRPTRPGTR